MTKKDYELLAETFRFRLDCAAFGSDRSVELRTDELYETALLLAGKLYNQNERFDRAKFLKACGFKS